MEAEFLSKGEIDDPSCPQLRLGWVSEYWRNYIYSPDHLDLYEFGDNEAPRSAGVYFLWGKEFALLYIGMSDDVLYRLNQHSWAGRIPFAYHSVIEMPIFAAPYIELAYICALRPPHNNKFGPIEWDGHQRAARLIERVWRRAKHADC
jgi:hypothetical protein